MHKFHNARRGVSMIEATIATLLIGMVITSTIGLIGPVMHSTEIAEKQIIARGLMNELVSEIVAQPFEDLELLEDVDTLNGKLDLNTFEELWDIGVDAGERSAIRADFDDVDDYDGWMTIPPSTKEGDTLVSLVLWGRQVTVEHVLISDLLTTSATRTGAKIIRIQVLHKGLVYADETFIRTESWDASRSGI
ncbi:MAG: hypothetical protein JKY96_03675 [Phycisphaerales bacterium]|nr:hypothetical protein [Phycisphaerales bacterium]